MFEDEGNKKKNKNQAILEEPVNTASSVEPQTVDAEEENDALKNMYIHNNVCLTQNSLDFVLLSNARRTP